MLRFSETEIAPTPVEKVVPVLILERAVKDEDERGREPLGAR